MMVAAQRAMTTREWGLLALLSLLWGGSYCFVGVAIREIPPLTLVTLRVGLAAALLWVGAPIFGVALPRDPKAIVALAVLGLCNNALPFALITWSQTRLPGGLASILVATTPLFTVLAAHVLTADEKLTGLKLFGTVAGMAGVAWLIGPGPVMGWRRKQCVGGNSGSRGGRLLRPVRHLRSPHAFFRTKADRRRGRAGDGRDRVSCAAGPCDRPAMDTRHAE